MSTPINAYPLLSVVPEAVYDAGDLGFVEVQLVLDGWHDDELYGTCG